MKDAWVYENEFLCQKCKRRWYELTVAYAVCGCGNVTWPVKIPLGCLRVREEVEV